MITKKKWKKLFLRAMLRADGGEGKELKRYVKRAANDFYGIVTCGELMAEGSTFYEDDVPWLFW